MKPTLLLTPAAVACGLVLFAPHVEGRVEGQVEGRVEGRVEATFPRPPRAEGQVEGRVEATFPHPPRALELHEHDPGEATLLDVLEGYSLATGDGVCLSDATRRNLTGTRLGLFGQPSVEPRHVHGFVQCVLQRHGYALGVLRTDAPRIYGVYAAGEAKAVDLPYLTVTPEEVRHLTEFPALLVQVALPGSRLDGAGGPFAERPLDPVGFNRCLTVGDAASALRGTASGVSAWLSAFAAADDAHDRAPQPVDAAAAGSGDGAARTTTSPLPHGSALQALRLVWDALDEAGAEGGALRVRSADARSEGVLCRVRLDLAVEAGGSAAAQPLLRLLRTLQDRPWLRDSSLKAVSMDERSGALEVSDLSLLVACDARPARAAGEASVADGWGLAFLELARDELAPPSRVDEWSLRDDSRAPGRSLSIDLLTRFDASGRPADALAFFDALERAVAGSSFGRLRIDERQGGSVHCHASLVELLESGS